MKNLGGNIKSLRNFMRKDAGVSGDGQRIEQLGWLLFLKILDASDRELELLKDDFVSVVPEPLRWGSWAADKEGMTGDALRLRSIPRESGAASLSIRRSPMRGACLA